MKVVSRAIRELANAVTSLNPDPAKTIADHRKGERRKELWLRYTSIVATVNGLVEHRAMARPAGIAGLPRQLKRRG